MLVAVREDDQIAELQLDRYAIEQVCLASAFGHQMIGNNVLGLGHEKRTDAAGRRGDVGPARPELGLEKYGSREPFCAQYVRECVHPILRVPCRQSADAVSCSVVR